MEKAVGVISFENKVERRCESRMNIFELPRYTWWEHMQTEMQNVNLDEIKILRKDCLSFGFSNSYNGNYCKTILWDNVLTFNIEKDISDKEEFPYFILDVYRKELTRNEISSSLNYYHYGYNIYDTQINNLYLVCMVGSDICIDMLCGKFLYENEISA